MRIALLHYAAPPVVGGVESVLAHHARLMTMAGHQVKILAGRGNIIDERIPVHIFPQFDSLNTEVLKVKGYLDQGDLIPEFDQLREQIEQVLLAELQGFDILIAHNVASLNKNLPLTAALHRAFQSPNFPRLILWHHDLAWTTPRYSSEMHSGYPWDLLRSNWDGAFQVVVSQLRCLELSHLLSIPKQSIRVIPNGVDIDTFFKFEEQTIQLVDQLNLDEADPLFLLPVRLTPRKNIELALHILAELRGIFPKAGLLVTGPEGPHNPANAAYKQKLLDVRNQLNLNGAVHFLAEVTSDFVSDAVIADLYRLADALLIPSLEEGFGIPIIEAAFSSIPVFCSDIPVLRELGGEDISYFDPHGDARSIASQISSRLESEATIRWARRAKHSYTWNSIYRMHIEPLIQEVVR